MASYQKPVLKIQKQNDKIIHDKDVQTQLWRILQSCERKTDSYENLLLGDNNIFLKLRIITKHMEVDALWQKARI